MMLLSLDCATRLGWCFGTVGQHPRWGSHDFGRGRSNGEVLGNFHNWLIAKIDAVRPDLIAFESPFVPAPNSRFATPMNALTVRRLFGFAAITEAVCHQRRIRCAESPPTEITRVLLGGPAPKGRAAKKAVTLQRVRALGFAVEDDDEADAVSLWLFAEGVFSPAMLSQRRAAAGLELNLHPRKTNAPRGKPRSALGVTTATMEPDHGSLDTNKNIDGKFQFQFAQV